MKTGVITTYPYSGESVSAGEVFWKKDNSPYKLIAYRIIDEPKICDGCKVNLNQDVCACNIFETKKEYFGYAGDYEGYVRYAQGIAAEKKDVHNCVMWRMDENGKIGCVQCNENKEEPKKQTLLEYAGEFINHITAQELSLLHMISKWAEQNKVDK